MKIKLLIMLFVPISCIAGDNLNDALLRARQAEYVQYQQEKIRQYFAKQNAEKQNNKQPKEKVNHSTVQSKSTKPKNKWLSW